MKIPDMLFTEVGVEGRGAGGQHRIELLDEEERERRTPIVAFDYGFMTLGRHVSNCDLSRQQVWSNWSDVLRTERSHSILHFISCWFHQRSRFSENPFEMR